MRASRFRMNHAHAHRNVQPLSYGRPFFEHNMDFQILCNLHLAKLGLPKTPWKHGFLNNLSDQGRERVSQALKEMKHPLDCRRKDDNRCRADKWFTGAAWHSFCHGQRGSPGGPVAIAKLCLLLAEDMMLADADKATEAEPEPTATEAEPELAPSAADCRISARGNKGGARRGGRGGRRGGGRSSFRDRSITTAPASTPAAESALATEAGVQYEPSELEKSVSQADLAMIREIYDSRAQEYCSITINTLVVQSTGYATTVMCTLC